MKLLQASLTSFNCIWYNMKEWSLGFDILKFLIDFILNFLLRSNCQSVHEIVHIKFRHFVMNICDLQFPQLSLNLDVIPTFVNSCTVQYDDQRVSAQLYLSLPQMCRLFINFQGSLVGWVTLYAGVFILLRILGGRVALVLWAVWVGSLFITYYCLLSSLLWNRLYNIKPFNWSWLILSLFVSEIILATWSTIWYQKSLKFTR